VRFRFKAFKGCKTCNGDGFIYNGVKTGFGHKNMEVSIEDDGYDCPDCSEKSMDNYDEHCEMLRDESRSERCQLNK
jgi:hypothetical protein